MKNDILLNNQIAHFGTADLPCLIAYGDKTWGSHFSVCLVTDLFRQGAKILFFTAYPSAREKFMEQITGEESKVIYVTDANDLTTDAQVIILESWNETLFHDVCNVLPDLHERAVLVKNMEVFGPTVFAACLSCPKLIISGNLDGCVAKAEISAMSFATTVIFKQPEIALPYTAPTLETYTAYLRSPDKEGMVRIDMD